MISSFHFLSSTPLITSVSEIHSHRRRRLQWSSKAKLVVSASLDGEVGHPSQLSNDETKERIRKMFDKVELSVSAYDTAWVAMVPSPTSPDIPCFPQCLKWLLHNQRSDGSWGINPHAPSLEKDLLSSTLACVLSLKKWGVGDEQINKGVRYIESKFEYATDEKQVCPTGFEIIFPRMIELVRDLNLNLALEAAHLRPLFQKRDLELQRITGSNLPGRKTYAAYISEGMPGGYIDEAMVKKYQRKNGSLFNSPSTTAAVSTSLFDSDCLSYLQKVLDQSGNAVPTVYPLDIYARLGMVDALTRTGIDHYFVSEIQNVMDTTYRCWEQDEEDIFLDVSTCAMAFRLLRVYGYKVSPGPLAQFATEEEYLDSSAGHLNDTNAVLELFRASEFIAQSDELVLKKINVWSRRFLKENCVTNPIQSDRLRSSIRQEVDDALKFPSYASLEQLENRRYMNIYASGNAKILKTSYICSNNGNKEILKLAAEDFNKNQPYLREEFSFLKRWYCENGLDNPQFARQGVWNIYFTAATVFVSPGLSDARLAWAKVAALTLLVDDLFDVYGSEDDLANFIFLIEKWDIYFATDSCSEIVKVLFSAVYKSITEIAESAKKVQGRDVTSHLIDAWLRAVRAMSKEAEWRRIGYLPTVDEYMSNGYLAFITEPIVVSVAYSIGVLLPEEAVTSAELHSLIKILGTIGRILNDTMTSEREIPQGKVNSLSLRMLYGDADSTKEAVIQEMMDTVEAERIELLHLVLQRDTVVPDAVKQVFWKMSRVLHAFYCSMDGMVEGRLSTHVDPVLHDPVSVDITSR